MARAYKCDVCGKLYEDDDFEQSLFIDNDYFYLAKTKGNELTFSDICKDCVSSLSMEIDRLSNHKFSGDIYVN